MPEYKFNVPWFLFDLTNYQLITSKIIPGDIRDTKQIVLAETPVPGLNYHPVFTSGGGNRHISFTLPLIKRNGVYGNVLLLQQFMMLRNQSMGLLSTKKVRFNPMPKVLYYWGTGSIPLPYFVAKCDAVHKAGWVNAAGAPQYSEIEMELILDEEDPLYKAEELYRIAAALAGEVTSVFDLASGGKPY